MARRRSIYKNVLCISCYSNDKLEKYWKTSLVLLFERRKKIAKEKLNNKKEFHILRFGKHDGDETWAGDGNTRNGKSVQGREKENEEGRTQ